MPLVDHVDYPNKRIYLSVETADALLDTIAIYKEVRALRRTNEDHRKFKPIIVAGGNVEKIAGTTYTPSYAQLLYGCRIVPFNGSHRITLVRDTFTDDGLAGRDCFDRTPLAASVEVDIDVQVDKIEIVKVNTSGGGGGGESYTLSQISSAVWSALNRTLTTTPTEPPTVAEISAGVWADAPPPIDPPTAQEVSEAVWTRIIESGLTAEQILRVKAAIDFGNASNLEGTNPTFKSLDGTKDRVVATYNNGTRTVISVDGT